MLCKTSPHLHGSPPRPYMKEKPLCGKQKLPPAAALRPERIFSTQCKTLFTVRR